MKVQDEIDAYVAGLPEPKRGEVRELQQSMLKLAPKSREWFFDGKNAHGKTVANPSIGYGERTLKYADGSTRDFYRVGISANTSGISVYVLGLRDKAYLAKTYGAKIGKAKVTGYCIKFGSLDDIDRDVLNAAVRHGLEAA